jgi:hypothetical protein
MVKRVNNVELKLTTLSEKLKKEQQSHACTTTWRDGKLQKIGGNPRASCFRLVYHCKAIEDI